MILFFIKSHEGGVKEMGNNVVKDAQALISKYAGTNEPVEQVVVEQTEAVVNRANPQPAPTPVVESPVNTAPVVPQQVVSQPPVVQEPVVQQQPQTLPEVGDIRAELEKAKQAYRSLQGKYNKELPDLRNDNAQLRVELNALRDEIQTARASVPETPKLNLKDVLGEEKVEELGENYVDMVNKAVDWKTSELLKNQEAESAKKIEAIQEQLLHDRWTNYNKTVGANVDGFIDLVDPMGDGNLDGAFKAFLESRYMIGAFDDADKNMDANVVIDICKMYQNTLQPIQTQVVQTQPVVNPKLQAVAPNTVNNSTPQLQATQPAYSFKQSDYIRMANAFASGKVREAEWLSFEKQYNEAVIDNRINYKA